MVVGQEGCKLLFINFFKVNLRSKVSECYKKYEKEMIRVKVYSYPPGGGWSEEGQEQKWGKEFMADKCLLSYSAAEAVANGFIEKQRN